PAAELEEALEAGAVVEVAVALVVGRAIHRVQHGDAAADVAGPEIDLHAGVIGGNEGAERVRIGDLQHVRVVERFKSEVAQEISHRDGGGRGGGVGGVRIQDHGIVAGEGVRADGAGHLVEGGGAHHFHGIDVHE